MTDNTKGKHLPKDGFIMQAGILAAAGILSRVIGLLYNSPMTAIIGDEGNGYYGYAYSAYTIVLLVSSYSIPSAISKVIAQRLAMGEYRNAHKIFKGALLYVIAVGGAAGLLIFFLADQLVVLSGSAIVLRYFAPTVLLSGILGVLRGYFQAHKTMMQTSFSQILEQMLNAGGSILLAFLLTRQVQAGNETQRAINGAIGGAIGTGVGMAAGLFFMWGIYSLNRGIIQKRIERDKTPEEESYAAVFKMILLVVTPFILSTFVYNVNTFLNQTIFNQVSLSVSQLGEVEVGILNSAVSKATKVSNIPIAVSSAMSAALIPGIAGDFTVGHKKRCREKVEKAIRITMFISIPAAMGIGVLARPIMEVLYPQKETLELSSWLLTMMAAGVIFYSLSTLSSAVLQGIGKVNSPVIHAAAALVLQTGALIAILYFTDMGVYAMALAVVVYALLMCIFNGLSVRKHLEYRQEWDKTFLRPVMASLLMGSMAFGVYHGVIFLCAVNLVALFAAVLTGSAFYFFLAVKWNILSKEEMERLPKGAVLWRWLHRDDTQKSQSKNASQRKGKRCKKDSKRVRVKQDDDPYNTEYNEDRYADRYDPYPAAGHHQTIPEKHHEDDDDYWLDE